MKLKKRLRYFLTCIVLLIACGSAESYMSFLDHNRKAYIKTDAGYDVSYITEAYSDSIVTMFVYPTTANTFFQSDATKLQCIKMVHGTDSLHHIEIELHGYPTSEYCSGVISQNNAGNWIYKPFLVNGAAKPKIDLAEDVIRHVVDVVADAKKALPPSHQKMPLM